MQKKMKKPRKRRTRYTVYGKEIKSIYRKFIEPLIPHINVGDNESSIRKAIHTFFQPDTRRVYFGKAKAKFRIPGKKWGFGPMELVPGVGRRHTAVGDPMIVRLDETMPLRVEIEYKEQIFVMTRPEYDSIEEHIEVIG
jgi:hypothetical protein